MICNADSEILYVNKAFESITGYTGNAVLGKKPRVLNSGYHDKSFHESLWKKINETGYWSGEIWNRRKSGEAYPEWLSINTLRNARGEVTHYVGTFFDISERKAAEQGSFPGPRKRRACARSLRRRKLRPRRPKRATPLEPDKCVEIKIIEHSFVGLSPGPLF